MTRSVLLIVHTGRRAAVKAAAEVIVALQARGIGVEVLPEESDALDSSMWASTGMKPNRFVTDSLDGCELAIVLGGDGTILRAAEVVRGTTTPLLGVNLGHVGFLAETERDDLVTTVRRVVDREYTVEERLCLDVHVLNDGVLSHRCWALNEASVEKAARERMLNVGIDVDGRPLSTVGCDGVVMATPTGSTAYSFSAGGPVVWPSVDALLLVPICAHALFSRPLVVGPQSVLGVQVIADSEGRGVLWCDGRRRYELQPGSRIEVRRSNTPVRLARLTKAPFTDRLVAKFDLPVQGWRARGQFTKDPETIHTIGDAGMS
ncbi:MAG: NAD kinase [Actinomycetota bacterium]